LAHRHIVAEESKTAPPNSTKAKKIDVISQKLAILFAPAIPTLSDSIVPMAYAISRLDLIINKNFGRLWSLRRTLR